MHLLLHTPQAVLRYLRMQWRNSGQLLALIGRRFVEARCLQAAASLAFTSLLSLVPLLTVTIVLFSNFPAFADLGSEFKNFLLQNLLPEKAGKIIATYALQFSEKAANLTLIGTTLLVLGAVSMLLTIEETFNGIWGVRRKRGLLTRLITYWTVLTIGPLLLAGSVFAGSYLLSVSLGLVNNPPWLREIGLRVLPLVLLGLLFGLLYLAIPNRRVKPLHALLGGFIAALAFVLMQRAIGYYITRFPTYTLIYGTFAALPIFLLWLHLSWVIILLGALFTAVLPDFEARERITASFPGDRAFAALLLLEQLARVQRHGGGALSPDTLIAAAHLPTMNGDLLLEALREAGWIAKTEDGRWLLACRAEDLHLSGIIARFALSPAHWAAHPELALPAEVAARLEHSLSGIDASLAELIATHPPATAG